LKISLIVEGDSDRLLLLEQQDWFNALGIEVEIVPTDGKINMIKKAKNFYKIAFFHQGVDFIIFLPDQNSDLCALVTRQKIGMDTQEKSVTIVLKRELEAWILADGNSIRDSIELQYSPSGITDTISNPKQNLHSLLKRKLDHFPTTLEAISCVKSYFSIERAANNNQSARRFKDFVENLSRDAS